MAQPLNIKKLQSETGGTGEHSPNLQMSYDALNELRENFKHVHGTITEFDACFAMIRNVVGTRLDGEAVTMLGVYFNGCHEDMFECFTEFLIREPKYIDILTMSCAAAMAYREQNDMSDDEDAGNDIDPT